MYERPLVASIAGIPEKVITLPTANGTMLVSSQFPPPGLPMTQPGRSGIAGGPAGITLPGTVEVWLAPLFMTNRVPAAFPDRLPFGHFASPPLLGSTRGMHIG